MPSLAPTGTHGLPFEPMRLAAHHEGKMPSPPGPVAIARARSGRFPSRGSCERTFAPAFDPTAFYGTYLLAGCAGETAGICERLRPTTGPWGRGHLALARAARRAWPPLRTNAPCGTSRGQDALAPRARRHCRGALAATVGGFAFLLAPSCIAERASVDLPASRANVAFAHDWCTYRGWRGGTIAQRLGPRKWHT